MRVELPMLFGIVARITNLSRRQSIPHIQLNPSVPQVPLRTGDLLPQLTTPPFPAIIVVIVTGGVYYSRRLENPEFYYGRMKDAAIV